MAPRDVIDAGCRLGYRMVYPLARRWWRWRGSEGCAIAVWRDTQVLAVLHSYKPGWRLPGGGVKRGEDPQAAAIRELYEETKVRVDPTEVSSAVVTKCYGARLVFEVELRDDPELRVDQREIVAAAFVAPMGLNETNAEVRRYLRMRAIERAKTVVISDHHG